MSSVCSGRMREICNGCDALWSTGRAIKEQICHKKWSDGIYPTRKREVCQYMMTFAFVRLHFNHAHIKLKEPNMNSYISIFKSLKKCSTLF